MDKETLMNADLVVEASRLIKSNHFPTTALKKKGSYLVLDLEVTKVTIQAKPGAAENLQRPTQLRLFE